MERNRDIVTIEIPLEEYKELLKTVGKYEELKSQQSIKLPEYNFKYYGDFFKDEDRKVTCCSK